MENIEKFGAPSPQKFSEMPEYQLAGRYVKRFLEVRTEGRRAHSWDHELYVAHDALSTWKNYCEKQNEQMDDDKQFSVYISSLLHDVIQPGDVRNKELRESMQAAWDLDVEGSEHSEGVKAFDFIVSELQEKAESEVKITDTQKVLIEKLVANKERILNIYSEKENKDLSELPWDERSVESKSLSLADLHGNVNPDMIVKFALYIASENSKKDPEKRWSVGDAFQIFSGEGQPFLQEPPQDAKPKKQFNWRMYRDEEIVNDWKDVAPETYADFEDFLEHFNALINEKSILDTTPKLQEICEKYGIGVYGMFDFWYKEGSADHRATSQEVFEKYAQFTEGRNTTDIAEKEGLSEDDTQTLLSLEQNEMQLVSAIRKWQASLAEAEKALGQKI